MSSNGYSIPPLGITAIVALAAGALVVACAAVSRVTGFGWPEHERNPHSVPDEQAAYMRQVRSRNWAGAELVAGARRHHR